MGCKNGRQIRLIVQPITHIANINPSFVSKPLPRELNNVNTNLDDEKKKTITDLIYSYFFY